MTNWPPCDSSSAMAPSSARIATAVWSSEEDQHEDQHGGGIDEMIAADRNLRHAGFLPSVEEDIAKHAPGQGDDPESGPAGPAAKREEQLQQTHVASSNGSEVSMYGDAR